MYCETQGHSFDHTATSNVVKGHYYMGNDLLTTDDLGQPLCHCGAVICDNRTDNGGLCCMKTLGHDGPHRNHSTDREWEDGETPSWLEYITKKWFPSKQKKI